jgi:hypothetical protein
MSFSQDPTIHAGVVCLMLLSLQVVHIHCSLDEMEVLVELSEAGWLKDRAAVATISPRN